MVAVGLRDSRFSEIAAEADITGWTLPPQMGVEIVRFDKPGDIPASRWL